ncbi:GntR family transcriptional regulator [Sciscionella sediminilitoris]|uniref:GntR family transcriptional regulator n=1 Tax=Sciscionella sediminilitoris TaxID=1445613 RepID=UPI00068D1D18|nr:GntR family transcriptional regulator [Sciscionella sp. SE31]
MTTSRAQRARQLAGVLRESIAQGTFDDQPLPDERALGQRLGASRNAVREALGLLRAEGLITRRRGIGTTVVRPKLGHGLDRLAGLAENLDGHGELGNEVRAARIETATPAIAERLEIEPGERIVYLERLRRIGGAPLSLDSTYLVADIGLPLLDRDLAGRDVFALIEETSGQRLGRSDVLLHAVNADPASAELLEVPESTAVFAVERCTRLADGRAVDFESIHLRADRISFHASLPR